MAKEKSKSKQEKAEENKFHIEFVKQLLTLSTAGFGLAAALAWNSLIQNILNTYLKPILGDGLFISGLIYAIIVTLLAVLVTLQLSKILRRLQKDKETS
jgi:hypothetical protein